MEFKNTQSHFFLFFLCFCVWLSPLKGQNFSLKEQKKLTRQAHELTSLDKNRWRFLKKELKHSKIVSIGEFTHGSREVNIWRNDLIDYLHQELNFEVILFETGIGELIEANEAKHDFSSKKMTHHLMWPWWTSEFNDLMQYVKDESLEIAGFDVQRSGRSFHKLIIETLPKYIPDSTVYVDLEKAYTRFDQRKRKLTYDSLKVETELLIKKYDDLYHLLEEKISAPNQRIRLIKKTLNNRVVFLRYQLDFTQEKDYRKRWTVRDSMMAKNAIWLIDKIYKDKKIIIIGHNFHLAKSNDKESIMGEWLHEKYGNEIYELAIFAGKGEYADNYGRAEKLLAADSLNLDIKHLIQSLEGEAYFISLGKKSDTWATQPITINNSFTDLNSTNQLILKKHFKAILFLKNSSLPVRDF